MADEGGSDAGSAAGLGELRVAGQCVDDVAGEVGAIGRGKRGAFLTLEVIGQQDLAVTAGEDQVKSPWNRRWASGTIMASDGACVETLSTWTWPEDER
jgi:hypothetical protein